VGFYYEEELKMVIQPYPHTKGKPAASWSEQESRAGIINMATEKK
jgi:hypothetical protein